MRKKETKPIGFQMEKIIFLDLKEKLLDAKETIFMTDRLTNPEVFLERPEKSRTIWIYGFPTSTKKRKPYVASKGVKIYILVYNECSLALTLQSKHTQEAYVGGFGLCWGRWDTGDLADENEDICYNFPGIDYSNARIADFNKVEEYLYDIDFRERKN